MTFVAAAGTSNMVLSLNQQSAIALLDAHLVGQGARVRPHGEKLQTG